MNRFAATSCFQRCILYIHVPSNTFVLLLFQRRTSTSSSSSTFVSYRLAIPKRNVNYSVSSSWSFLITHRLNYAFCFMAHRVDDRTRAWHIIPSASGLGLDLYSTFVWADRRYGSHESAINYSCEFICLREWLLCKRASSVAGITAGEICEPATFEDLSLWPFSRVRGVWCLISFFLLRLGFMLIVPGFVCTWIQFNTMHQQKLSP